MVNYNTTYGVPCAAHRSTCALRLPPCLSDSGVGYRAPSGNKAYPDNTVITRRGRGRVVGGAC